MKNIFLTGLFAIGYFTNFSQLPVVPDTGFNNRINNLQRQLATAKEDSVRIIFLQGLNFNYEPVNADSSLKYGLMALDLSRRTKNIKQEAATLIIFGYQGELSFESKEGEGSRFIISLPVKTSRL